MNTVFVCNLPADSSLLQRSYLNQLAQCYGPAAQGQRAKYIHTELFFPDAQSLSSTGDIRSGIGARIVYGGTVELGAKSFSRNTWDFTALSVTPKQRQEMLRWLGERRGAKFDKWGYFTGWHSANQYYCSRLVGQCLQQCNVVPDLTPNHFKHPEALHQAVVRLGHTFVDTPRTLARLNI